MRYWVEHILSTLDSCQVAGLPEIFNTEGGNVVLNYLKAAGLYLLIFLLRNIVLYLFAF